MNLRVIGWTGFIFLGSGLLIVLFGPKEWRSYGCGALLTAATVYGAGLFLVVRQVARIHRAANEMMRRVAEDLERRKGGGQKVIDVEKLDSGEEKSN